MSKALARAELVATLAPRMAARGFPLVKSKQWYQHKQSGLKQIYELEFVDRVDYSVRPGIRMRIDEMEKIFHRTSGFEKKYQSGHTIGISLMSYVRDHKQFRYNLGHVDQVPQIASQIESAFDTVAAPWFEKYSTVAALDALLNTEPDKLSSYYLVEWVRCAHGLIAARLTHRPDYDKLAATYSKAMKRISKGFYSDDFEALVRDLEDDELIERSRRKLQAQGLLGA